MTVFMSWRARVAALELAIPRRGLLDGGMLWRRTGGGAGASLALAVLLGAVVVVEGGCALLPLGGRPAAAPGGAPSPVGRGLRDYRVAFHCHSHLSHDSEVPFDRIAAAARELGFNAVLLNDHLEKPEEEEEGHEPSNIERSPHGFWDGVLFVPGVEMREERTHKERRPGSLLLVGLERSFEVTEDEPLPRLLERLTREGALVAAGHCEDFSGWDRYPLAAYEVYNLHTQFKRASILGLVLRALFLLPDPFFEAHVRPLPDVLLGYDARLAAGQRLAPLAGHDAHEARLFGSWGPRLGTYPEVLRLFSNHLLAPELTREALLEAIRRRRTYISFDFLGDPAGFSLTYGEPLGASPAILGEEAPWRPQALLEVRVPREGRIRVLRDGAPWAEALGREFASHLPGPGVYRVEVHRPWRWGRERLWILAAPLWIGEGRA